MNASADVTLLRTAGSATFAGEALHVIRPAAAMQKESFADWAEFDEFVRKLEDERHKANPPAGKGGTTLRSELLFRGHSSEKWNLQTTLERVTSRLSLYHYLELARDVQQFVETFTGEAWSVPRFDDLHKWQKDDRIEGNLASIFDYLVFLRHHGFPSPFMDWSRSRHVAEFFAFDTAKDGNVAIYIYQRTRDGSNVIHKTKPIIRTFGPRVGGRTPRHFAQHSVYTFATQFDDGHGWKFVSHDLAVSEHEETPHHNVWKCLIPATERSRVLKRLDDHSLNAFSLCQSTDALMKALAVRHIDLHELNK